MRIRLLKIAYLLIFIAILIRLFYWQVWRFDDMTALAEQQHLSTSTIEGMRGMIFSSDGALMASNKPTFLLFGLPQIIKDKEEVSKKLAVVLVTAQKEEAKVRRQMEQSLSQGPDSTISAILNPKVEPEEIDQAREKIRKRLSEDLQWTVLEKGLSLSTKKQIEEMKVYGIGFESESSRFYPEASMAAHILGFVGSDQLGNAKGYFGIEGFYNGQLKGVGGVIKEEKDAQGMPILFGRFAKKEAKQGRDLVLTIDRSVQYIAEKKLKMGVSKYGAKSGSVVVMDPQTGALLAMASYPNYDPNNYTLFPKEYFRNPLVADSYEPGSTFKVLVMAAGLNEEVIKPDTKCDSCDGPVSISGHTIRTWNNKYYKDTTMADVIIHSDNTGMVFIGKKLGLDKFYKYIEDFGFGNLTDIDLQDEASPDIREKNDWREIDLATASFGQGIAVTPIQMVRAVSAIANGGKLMEPHIVQAIKEGGKVSPIKPKVVGIPIKKEAAKEVTEMMVQAVSKGEAKVFAPKGFKIAGKTGTAQIPVAGHYDPTKTIASFVGFAPADNPKFVMLVRYVEPSSSIFGAETAAPTFFEIAKELLPYYNIAPTE